VIYFGFSTYEAYGSNQYPFNSYSQYNLNTPWFSYQNPPTSEIIDYYANLLIIQYIGKPKAYATIQAVVGPVIIDQLPTVVENAFQLSTAIGVQLDVLGDYAGVSRNGYGPSGNPITLNDSDFMKLIQIAIGVNTSNGSLASIQQILNQYFAGDILVFDTKNMQMSYLVNSNSVSLDLIELFITEGLLPKPMGVQLASVVYAPDIDMFFGLRTYQAAAVNASPLNSYTDYETDRPFLTYEDVL
jgi:Protein of unknown function (DUF2612)